MLNAFNIDKGGNTVSDTHLLNETFHIFSKSPASPGTTLEGARLKSGHTTTTSDIWADEIPAFFKAATENKFDLFEKKASKDDLCLYNGYVYVHNGTAFENQGKEDAVLTDGAEFSKNGVKVIKYHKNRTAINLTADNNNGDDSNNYAAKIYNANSGSTTFVPQFISSTDKVVDGIPSLGYNAVVSYGTKILAEGLTDIEDYICNSYAGVIQFNQARPSGVTISAWEYIGDKLNDKVDELHNIVFGDSNDSTDPENTASLSQQVNRNTQAIAELQEQVNGSDDSEGPDGLVELIDKVAKLEETLYGLGNESGGDEPGDDNTGGEQDQPTNDNSLLKRVNQNTQDIKDLQEQADNSDKNIEELWKIIGGNNTEGGNPDNPGGNNPEDNPGDNTNSGNLLETVGALGERVTKNEGDIQELFEIVLGNGDSGESGNPDNSTTTNLKETVEKNTKDIGDLDERVTENEGNISDLDSSLTSLVGQVNELKDLIGQVGTENPDDPNDPNGPSTSPEVSLLSQVNQNTQDIKDLQEEINGEDPDSINARVEENKGQIEKLWEIIGGNNTEGDEPENTPGQGSPETNTGNLVDAVNKNKEDITSISNSVSELQTDLDSFKTDNNNNFNYVVQAIASHHNDNQLHGGSGINVYTDTDKNYISDPNPISAVTDIKFFGNYINVVDHKDGSISLYIGENKDPAEFNSITQETGIYTSKYVYEASDGSYDTGDIELGNEYSRCQAPGDTSTYWFNNKDVITIPNDNSTVSVTLFNNKNGEIASAETRAINGSIDDPTDNSITAEKDGITIKVSDIHKNTGEDAKDGMTPEFIRCRISVTIDNRTAITEGGYYKIKVTVGNKDYSKDYITPEGAFVWRNDFKTPSIEKVKADYESTGTKVVSGITYDSSAKVKLNVTGIKNTQSMVTQALRRIKISDNSNGRLGDIGDLTVADLSAANGTSKTAANAEFSYSGEIIFTNSHDPAIMTGTYTATPYKAEDNSPFSSASGSGSFAGEKYLWNGVEGTENDATSSFHVDGKRLAYTVLHDDNGNVTGLDLRSTATYYSDKFLDTDYPQQLLIQGGYLKHPGGTNMDVTGKYDATNCTGTRYWTKLIKTDESSDDAKETFTITGSGFKGKDVKIWAVCSNSDTIATEGEKALLLNALGADGGFAKSVTDTSLSVEIPGAQMTCKQNSCFYLVVQLPKASTVKIGAITVA